MSITSAKSKYNIIFSVYKSEGKWALSSIAGGNGNGNLLGIDVKIFFSTHTKEITKDAQKISHGFVMGWIVSFRKNMSKA